MVDLGFRVDEGLKILLYRKCSKYKLGHARVPGNERGDTACVRAAAAREGAVHGVAGGQRQRRPPAPVLRRLPLRGGSAVRRGSPDSVSFEALADDVVLPARRKQLRA
jgi:hypothetical protein